MRVCYRSCSEADHRLRWRVTSKSRKSRRPVMRVLDLLSRRWALRILWELRDGPRTFRALRDACDDVSPSSLNQRLAELRALGAVERSADGYGLTVAGARLGKILLDLHRWAERHVRSSKRAATSGRS
jgi:DNA-binding HxlR family transcriptional regulator